MTRYNVLFNSTRPREYDGSHIVFDGMNPEITLREHQRTAIAHVLYGGNTPVSYTHLDNAAKRAEEKAKKLAQRQEEAENIDVYKRQKAVGFYH